jgi:hypothetical protein
MSFTTVAQCATTDSPFSARVQAGYALEGVAQPDGAWHANRWLIAADPSIAAAYESAVIGGNPDPGGDPAAITDAMITAAVQAYPWTPPTPPV